MPEGTGRLLAQAKAERHASGTATDEELRQGSALLKRMSTGKKSTGKLVIPAAKPRPERPEPADVDMEKGEVPGEKHASKRSFSIDLPEQPEPEPEPVAVKEAEEFVDDDPLALILGEGDVGLMEEVHKVAADDSVYSSREPHPLALFRALSRDFNRLEWTMWEPEAIVQAIAETSSAPPSEEVRNMIGALAGLVESEAFWNEFHVFLWTAQALNGEVPDMTILPELRPEEVVFAVGVAHEVRDDTPMSLPNGDVVAGVRLSEDILATIAAVFHTAGLVYAPEPVKGANEYLAKLQGPAGRDLARRVEKAWDVVSAETDPQISDDDVGIQLARLLDVREYVRNPYAR